MLEPPLTVDDIGSKVALRDGTVTILRARAKDEHVFYTHPFRVEGTISAYRPDGLISVDDREHPLDIVARVANKENQSIARTKTVTATIPVECPIGYRPVAVRSCESDDLVVLNNSVVYVRGPQNDFLRLVVEKEPEPTWEVPEWFPRNTILWKGSNGVWRVQDSKSTISLGGVVSLKTSIPVLFADVCSPQNRVRIGVLTNMETQRGWNREYLMKFWQWLLDEIKFLRWLLKAEDRHD